MFQEDFVRKLSYNQLIQRYPYDPQNLEDRLRWKSRYLFFEANPSRDFPVEEGEKKKFCHVIGVSFMRDGIMENVLLNNV